MRALRTTTRSIASRSVQELGRRFPDFFEVGAFQRVENEEMDERHPFAGLPPDEIRTVDVRDDALERARAECAAS
jgi:hypothetical protein